MKTLGSFLFAIVLPFAGVVPVNAARPLVTCTVLPDREVLPADASVKTVIKVLLDVPETPREAERPPVNVALVLDRSGSMSGNKIVQAREALAQALRRLTPRDIVSVVIFDHEVETLLPAQPARYTEEIEARIHGIQPRGMTAIFGAVSQGAAEIRKNMEGAYIHRIILLSDGIANVGPSSPGDLGRLGAALMKEGISVTTIGMGLGYNEALMAQLARQSDGNHYFVESEHDLPRILAAELGDLLSVVARRVVVEVECPPGVQPLRIIGRDGEIRGQRAEIQMNQLYGGQAKYALLEVNVPPTQADRTLELAVARARYENALTSRLEESEARGAARFSADEETVRRSANPDVQREVTFNVMAEVREEALDLHQAGRQDEAVRRLRAARDDLTTRNVAFGFDDLAAEASVLDADAETFERPSLPTDAGKAIRAESHRVRTQQRQ